MLSLVNPLLFAGLYNHFPSLNVLSIEVFWKDMGIYYSSCTNMHQSCHQNRFSWSFLFRALFTENNTKKKIKAVVCFFFLLQIQVHKRLLNLHLKRHAEKKWNQTATRKKRCQQLLFISCWKLNLIALFCWVTFSLRSLFLTFSSRCLERKLQMLENTIWK